MIPRPIKTAFPVFFLLCILSLSAQTPPLSRITGVVMDRDSGLPVHMADVFLSGTMLGSATDSGGRFTIRNIPPGFYQIVVSHIGYDLAVKPLAVGLDESPSFEFELHPRILEGEAVEVTALEPKTWRKRYREFEEVILGNTKNRKKCRILNPEILRFTDDPDTGERFAHADHPLKIRNLALGYQMSVRLDLVRWLEDKRTFTIKFFPKFDALKPESEKEKRRWEKNREKSYHGSFRHFLTALANNTLEAEGFQVSVEQVWDPLNDGFNRYSRLPAVPVSRDSLLQLSGKPWTFMFHYRWPIKVLMGNQIYAPSYVIFKYPAEVSMNGLLEDPMAVSLVGQFSERRLADWLPYDYIIEKTAGGSANP